MSTAKNLYPRLIVADADAAIDFYQSALDATLLERFIDGTARVVHAALELDGSIFSVAQSVSEWGLLDPLALGGSPCLLHLDVENPDEMAERMVQAGARVIIPIADRPYGKREGRIADPSHHLWILSKTIEDLTPDQIAKRLRAEL